MFTLAQSSILHDALVHYRNMQVFIANAIHSTDDERNKANEALIIIDKLLNY